MIMTRMTGSMGDPLIDWNAQSIENEHGDSNTKAEGH